MLRWRCALGLAVAVCHPTGCGRPAAPPAPVSASATAPPELELTVATLNLYHDKEAWPERRVPIAAALRELRPDVIALEEVIGHETLRNQAESLAEELGYQLTFSSTDPPGRPLRYGNAILTRHPVLRSEWTRLAPLDDSRTAAHVRIAVGGRAVNVYVTHLHYKVEGGAVRAEQLRDLLAFIEETDGGAPSIVAGDLNAGPDAPELAILDGRFASSYDALHPGARDDPAHATLNPHFFPDDHRRIDHVYLQRGRLEPLESRIILDRPTAAGRWPSDHFGLVTRLRVSPADPMGWRDPSVAPDARAARLLAAMTLDEKLRLLRADFGDASDRHPMPPGARRSAGFVPENQRLGIPALHESDAGLGVVTRGAANGRGATALPAMLATAASWDPDLAYAGGAMIGRQAWRRGLNVLLAGSGNLQRDPRAGRNFEYAGEDPLLAGTLVGHAIRGVQSSPVVSTMKHFALNDLETGRNSHDARIGEAALRESDLLVFELANRIGRPGSVMCAYNELNGAHACEHAWLLRDVLKGEWGFAGWVMSDWGAVHSAGRAALAGLDQQSAGEVFDREVYFDRPLRDAIASGQVPMARIDDMAGRILRTMFVQGLFDRPGETGAVDLEADGAVARRIAAAGAVLLENHGDLLPLGRGVRSIAVIGGHADVGVLSGGGSSSVIDPRGDPVTGLSPTTWPGPVRFHPSSPLRAIQALAPRARVRFASGEDIRAAARLAGQADVAVVFATQWTAESFDVPTMALPGDQDALIAAVARANRRTVVVLETGGPVRMPWLERVGAVLEVWYPGSRGGEAIADLLFGVVPPSGRLPMTWPRDEAQLPRPQIAGAGLGSKQPPAAVIDYDVEGANVGYKWFAARGLEPLYPFGHGLGTTSFARANLKVVSGDGPLRVYFDVTNTGARPGIDVPQVYLELPPGSSTPLRLIGWHKLAVEPGKTERVGVVIEPRLLESYDARAGRWVVPPGRYRVSVGGSAGERDLVQELQLPAPR